ncbi:helix-turn-helix transcriptional regulator [Campylobacter californiensis]|uniref:helix-turn-helix transcriptional regulator n=1 Tax=Campylobacter californiensis TaxID=1032243 RepID=UPI001475EA7D|nr:AraC family transcriptional regulator [Campylobacter sp. RM12916]MBE3609976.1 helix-turn-helix transcriptional regulator [Campylobacter sp. RM12916]
MRLGLRSVSICTPIKLVDKRGVFCGGQPFEVIRSYFKEYKTLYDKNLYLINKGGEILASFGNINDTISFENVNLPNDKYMAIPIKNTNWSIVFEKDQELYTNELNKYLLINLLLYALCVLIYIFTNFIWLRKNSISSKQLNEQNIYIKDVLTKQVNGVFISCNEDLEIIYAGDEFANFYDFYNGAANLKEAIRNSKFLSDDEKLNFLNEIVISSRGLKFRYFNIEFTKENEVKKYLITTAPIGDHAPYGLSFLFQDVSLMQEQESQKTYNEFYNPYVEKLMIFIKQNIGDDGLCVEKLAKIGGYSKFHLQRLFKNYTNTNVAEYLRSFRLERARFLLKFSDEKVSVIAKKCGFAHNETFIRLFSKFYGSSPLVYRQNIRGKIPKKELLYEEIELPEIKLAVTHKPQNIEFLKSKQSGGDILVLLENGDINSKIYAAYSKDGSLSSYVELSGGTWAKMHEFAN